MTTHFSDDVIHDGASVEEALRARPPKPSKAEREAQGQRDVDLEVDDARRRVRRRRLNRQNGVGEEDPLGALQDAVLLMEVTTGRNGLTRLCSSTPTLQRWTATSADPLLAEKVLAFLQPDAQTYDINNEPAGVDRGAAAAKRPSYISATLATQSQQVTNHAKIVLPAAIHTSMCTLFGKRRADALRRFLSNVVSCSRTSEAILDEIVAQVNVKLGELGARPLHVSDIDPQRWQQLFARAGEPDIPDHRHTRNRSNNGGSTSSSSGESGRAASGGAGGPPSDGVEDADAEAEASRLAALGVQLSTALPELLDAVTRLGGYADPNYLTHTLAAVLSLRAHLLHTCKWVCEADRGRQSPCLYATAGQKEAVAGVYYLSASSHVFSYAMLYSLLDQQAASRSACGSDLHERKLRLVPANLRHLFTDEHECGLVARELSARQAAAAAASVRTHDDTRRYGSGLPSTVAGRRFDSERNSTAFVGGRGGLWNPPDDDVNHIIMPDMSSAILHLAALRGVCVEGLEAGTVEANLQPHCGVYGDSHSLRNCHLAVLAASALQSRRTRFDAIAATDPAQTLVAHLEDEEATSAAAILVGIGDDGGVSDDSARDASEEVTTAAAVLAGIVDDEQGAGERGARRSTSAEHRVDSAQGQEAETDGGRSGGGQGAPDTTLTEPSSPVYLKGLSVGAVSLTQSYTTARQTLSLDLFIDFVESAVDSLPHSFLLLNSLAARGQVERDFYLCHLQCLIVAAAEVVSLARQLARLPRFHEQPAAEQRAFERRCVVGSELSQSIAAVEVAIAQLQQASEFSIDDVEANTYFYHPIVSVWVVRARDGHAITPVFDPDGSVFLSKAFLVALCAQRSRELLPDGEEVTLWELLRPSPQSSASATAAPRYPGELVAAFNAALDAGGEGFVGLHINGYQIHAVLDVDAREAERLDRLVAAYNSGEVVDWTSERERAAARVPPASQLVDDARVRVSLKDDAPGGSARGAGGSAMPRPSEMREDVGVLVSHAVSEVNATLRRGQQPRQTGQSLSLTETMLGTRHVLTLDGGKKDVWGSSITRERCTTEAARTQLENTLEQQKTAAV